MGIILDHPDTIHEDSNEQWGQLPTFKVDENVIAEGNQKRPGQVEKSAKTAISKRDLHIHLH